MRERTYTTFQIAEVCGVYPSTVINWVKNGDLKAFKTPGGHRRVLESELREFLVKFNFPMPAWLAVGKRRVLIVEDDPAVGKLLVRALKGASEELDVTWLKDGAEALLAMGREAPDLVLLDVFMPFLDGGVVLKTIRGSGTMAKTRVIGITGKRLEGQQKEDFESLTDAFFLKPFDIKVLVEKAINLLRTAPSAPKSPTKTK